MLPVAIIVLLCTSGSRFAGLKLLYYHVYTAVHLPSVVYSWLFSSSTLLAYSMLIWKCWLAMQNVGSFQPSEALNLGLAWAQWGNLLGKHIFDMAGTPFVLSFRWRTCTVLGGFGCGVWLRWTVGGAGHAARNVRSAR